MVNIPRRARQLPQHKIRQHKMSAVKRVQNVALGGHREPSQAGMYNTLTQTLPASTTLDDPCLASLLSQLTGFQVTFPPPFYNNSQTPSPLVPGLPQILDSV